MARPERLEAMDARDLDILAALPNLEEILGRLSG
jgi:hypothetical protein